MKDTIDEKTVEELRQNIEELAREKEANLQELAIAADQATSHLYHIEKFNKRIEGRVPDLEEKRDCS